MAASGLTPNTRYTLRLGETWNSMPTELVHSVQYDFKPASVDSSQPGQMKLDDNNGVCVILPHKDSDEFSEFKGNKQPSSKECFLIVDRKTNTVYLEKISNTIRVKKYRVSKKPVNKNLPKKEDRPNSPVVTTAQPSKPASPQAKPAKSESPNPKRVKESEPNSLVKSSGLSSESSGSQSDSSNESSDENSASGIKSADLLPGQSSMFITPLETEPKTNASKNDSTAVENTSNDSSSNTDLMNMLSQDLDLSDSDTDSD